MESIRPLATSIAPPLKEDAVAFVFLALGDAALTPGVEYAIRSLRSVGGYRGRIFLLTDRPDCFKHHGTLNFRQQTFLVYVTPPAVPVRREDPWSEEAGQEAASVLARSELLDRIPVDVEFAVFLGADVLTVGGGCVADFLQRNVYNEGPGSWQPEMAIRLLWPAGGDPRTSSYVLRRHYSEGLMRQWAEEHLQGAATNEASLATAARKLFGSPEATAEEGGDTAWRRRFVGALALADADLRPGKNIRSQCFVRVSSATCSRFSPANVDDMLRGVIPDYARDMCRVPGSVMDTAFEILEYFRLAPYNCAKKSEMHLHKAMLVRVLSAVQCVFAIAVLLSVGFACLRWVWRRYRRATRKKKTPRQPVKKRLPQAKGEAGWDLGSSRMV